MTRDITDDAPLDVAQMAKKNREELRFSLSTYRGHRLQSAGVRVWVFEVAMQVAVDWQYRGRRVHHGAVVYCAFEGQTGMEARTEAFGRRFMQGRAQGVVPFYLQPERLDLVHDHPELTTAIRSQIGDKRPVLIVLDTLDRIIRGCASDDEDMSADVNAAGAVRKKAAVHALIAPVTNTCCEGCIG